MTKFPVLMALAAASLFGAQIPRKAPEFVFQMPDGSQKLLSGYRGKTLVVAFYYTTCSHCQHSAGVMAKVQEEYKDKGVQVLAATFDDGAASRVVQFTKQLGLNFPVGVSNPRAVLEFLQIPVTDPYFVPILVFIDKRGMIRSQYVGDTTFLEKQEANVRSEIDRMLKGPVTTSKTPAAKTATPKS